MSHGSETLFNWLLGIGWVAVLASLTALFAGHAIKVWQEIL